MGQAVERSLITWSRLWAAGAGGRRGGVFRSQAGAEAVSRGKHGPGGGTFVVAVTRGATTH